MATEQRSRLVLVPIPLDEANAYVERHHRHSNPTVGHKFSLGAARAGEIVGEVTARSWDTPSRPRVDKHPLQERFRWEAPA